jgi:sortase A
MRTAVRGTGELLITAGLVVLLFVAYQLVWTNYEAHKATDSVSSDLRDSWDRPDPTGASGATTRGPKKVDFGKGFAFLHIPRLGKNWTIPVVEGVDLPSLAKGVGHYPKTAQPGQVGNFAVAGHRATNGEPFAYLDKMR